MSQSLSASKISNNNYAVLFQCNFQFQKVTTHQHSTYMLSGTSNTMRQLVQLWMAG